MVLEELEQRSTGLSSKELELHCRSIRQNVDCLVWQQTQCSPSAEGQERSSDVMRRGWKYLQSICDAFGGNHNSSWWQSRCFQRDDAKQCEKQYGGSGSTKLRSSCIEYERFRDCVSDVVKRRCEPEDSSYLGSFLLDKAGEMVWRCPGQAQRSQNIYGSSSAYSSALSADTSYTSGCNARAAEEIRGCRDRHQYERDQSLGTREIEERERRACCAAWNYRRCFENAIRTHCYDSREVVFPGATGIVGHERDHDCLDYWRYTCSAARRISVTSLMLVFFVKCATTYIFE